MTPAPEENKRMSSRLRPIVKERQTTNTKPEGNFHIQYGNTNNRNIDDFEDDASRSTSSSSAATATATATATASGGSKACGDSSPGLYDPQRVITEEQLQVFNVLIHPVWIFDIQHKCMRWANSAAVQLWNASSLAELQKRSFADMSSATITRLASYQLEFQEGRRMVDQWTFYPQGEPKTVQVTGSGIRLHENETELSMLVEGLPILKEDIQPEILRGVEMLRHLPHPVCQFDMDGKVMWQNPEDILQAKQKVEVEEGKEREESKEDNFCDRFEDVALGKQVLKQLHENQEERELVVNLQANIKTCGGVRWSDLQLKRTSDPVTAQPVFLYSSKDLSDAVRAQKERASNIKKSEFLAIMAHEIRTPLHQVNGFIDLLEDSNLDTEQRSLIRLLKASACGLMTVISDVLDYSKLEAGKMKMESIPYDIRGVIEGSVAAVRSSCEEKGIDLVLDVIDKEVPFKLNGDPNRLRQVLLNLLSNAVKFTKQGEIQVALALVHDIPCKQPMLRFQVTDSGIGITEENKKLIFKKYQQGGANVARNFGGTGLGLSICKYLVEHMGGIIGVESIHGEGSTFWFTLPITLPNEASIANETKEEDESFMKVSLNVLIAEDNKVNQKLLLKMLERMGHTSDIAFNGEEAVDKVSRNSYDVILMDVQMPVMDGLEATRRIRSMGNTTIPIIGLTANVSRSDFSELGFTDWIPKPTSMKILQQRLRQFEKLKFARVLSQENALI